MMLSYATSRPGRTSLRPCHVHYNFNSGAVGNNRKHAKPHHLQSGSSWTKKNTPIGHEIPNQQSEYQGCYFAAVRLQKQGFLSRATMDIVNVYTIYKLEV